MASMVLAGLLSLLIAVFGIVLASDMAGVFGLDEATSDLATRTIQWLSFFNLAFAVAFVLQAALRASGLGMRWIPRYGRSSADGECFVGSVARHGCDVWLYCSVRIQMEH